MEFQYTYDFALVKPNDLITPQTDLTKAIKKTSVYDLDEDGYIYCVEFVQAKISTFPRGIGVARNLITQTDLPAIGAVIKTNESDAGHVGIVLSYTDTTVTFEEYNYISSAYSKRTLQLDDSRIQGYWWY